MENPNWITAKFERRKKNPMKIKINSKLENYEQHSIEEMSETLPKLGTPRGNAIGSWRREENGRCTKSRDEKEPSTPKNVPEQHEEQSKNSCPTTMNVLTPIFSCR